jgi:predicted nucleic acid-binding protein
LAEVERPIVLDTDVVSLIMRGQLDLDAAGLYDHTWCVSFVTVGELVKGAAAANWGLRKWTRISDWLRDVVVLPYDFNVATTWGLLSGAAMRRGQPRPVNDTWTAAVSLVNGLPLATRNVKDFQPLAEHNGLVLVPV